MAARKAEHHRRKHARDVINRAGYRAGGHVHPKDSDAEQDKAAVAKGVHAHERHDHKGEPLTKLKSGGAAHGMARGGHAGKGKRGGNHTTNVIIAGHHPGGAGGPGLPTAAPVPGGAPAAPPPPQAMAPPIPPRRPIGMQMPGAGGGMGGMMKRGGVVRHSMKAGAGSGAGRVEKAVQLGYKKRNHGERGRNP